MRRTPLPLTPDLLRALQVAADKDLHLVKWKWLDPLKVCLVFERVSDGQEFLSYIFNGTLVERSGTKETLYE